MRVLFLLEHFYPYIGGAEELFINLASGLVKRGHKVVVVTTKYDSSLPKHEFIDGVEIRRVSCFNRYLFTLFAIPSAVKYAVNADIIQTTSYNSAIPAFLAGLIRGKKVIITFHEVWGSLWHKLPFTDRWKLNLFRLFEKLILRLPFRKYVAVSKSTMGSLQDNGVERSKIEVIYNGIDYSRFEQFRYDPPVVFTYCYFGRLGISKGLDLLIEGSALFFAEHPQARLKLIIPTYPRVIFKKVIELINRHGISDRVTLLHDLAKDELYKEISESSCVMIPSISEGFCFVAAESAGLGIPVITSGRGSLKEVVSGKLIEIEELNAFGIREALKLALKGQWSYREPVRFSLNESVERYIELYEKVNSN